MEFLLRVERGDWILRKKIFHKNYKCQLCVADLRREQHLTIHRQIFSTGQSSASMRHSAAVDRECHV